MSQLNLGQELIIDSDYSTTEKKTGATWIDGKPIYRRVISGTTPSTSDYTQILSLSGIAFVISSEGYVFDGSSTSYCLNWYISATNFFSTIVKNDSVYVTMGASTGLKSKSIYIAIEYTKITD